MEEKEVTTRKDHECAACGETIPSGSIAVFISGRLPTFDKDDNQDGIEYINDWIHKGMTCMMPERCKNGDHEFERALGDLGVKLDEAYCIHCGKRKDWDKIIEYE